MKHGDRFGSGSNSHFGQGNFVRQLPQNLPKLFADFSGGYMAMASQESIPENAAAEMVDFFVTEKNRLRRLPGTTQSELYADRSPNQMVLHASLNFASELVLFDPPYVGVKGAADTTWVDAGLLEGDYFAHTNFGGTLIFSNGRGATYARQADATGIETLEEAGPARALAAFAGRVYLGGAEIDGVYEPLGIRWSAANSDYRDFTSTGSGFELLIGDMPIGDRIVATRTMGLNLMAVLNRSSLWIGRFTGNPLRPADFEPREIGVGTVNERVCRTTKRGVLFLSDLGVMLFDGNQSTKVSGQINSELLPLDYDNLDQYHATFDVFRNWYFLHTPTATWIYDLDYNRWYKSSLTCLSSAVFFEQVPGVTWEEVGGLWNQMGDLTWSDFRPEEGKKGSINFLGVVAGGTELASSDEDSTSFFGAAFEPYWRGQVVKSPDLTGMFTTKAMLVEFSGPGGAIVKGGIPNTEGIVQDLLQFELGFADQPRVVRQSIFNSGMGLGISVRMLDGFVEFTKLGLEVMPRGPRIEDAEFLPREYLEEFDT